MKMLENGVLDMTSTVLKLFFYTFQDCIQLTSSRKECFLVFFVFINLKVCIRHLRLGKKRFRTFLKIFIMIFRANDDISMCSLLKYGKSVVKCVSDPPPPGKAGKPGLFINK